MLGDTKTRILTCVGLLSIAVLTCSEALAATKAVDLDGNAANGAESQCELNVLQTFPVQVENKVTNKSVGDAYSFSWPSAGPGGFTSSVTAGTTGGVGAKWVWTTNQSVFAFTGNSCNNDVCFTQTAGTDALPGFCSDSCLADGTAIALAKGATAGTVALSWTGGQSLFTVYRSTSRSGLAAPANAVGTTSTQSFTDTPPADVSVYYLVRGVDCATRKACATNTDCSAPSDGFCVDRGPFGVPGRSLLANDVTVSAASLTSSLITFFSPPKEVFRATSTANAGGFAETLTNPTITPISATVAAYPPGCCPLNPEILHPLRCGTTCVDYLNDPANCGSCGNVCNDGTCCSDGACESVCGEGRSWCDGQCADLQDDSDNCGACGNVCGDGTCCNAGSCESVCPAGEVWCDGQCVDLQSDDSSCGSCGNACGDGTCCNAGACASVCAAGQVFCNGQCVDLQSDATSCGSCGNACGGGSCCSDGVCASVCGSGQTWCNGQCADFQNDSNNCGACGNACGEGSCCSAGVCASLCESGRTYCGGVCYDTRKDPSNCGACGVVCAEDSICSGGVCSPCIGQGGAKDACENRCVNLNTDPYNCGACGISCNEGCPSGFKGVCSNGQSCRCVAGTPAPQPPSDIPPPTSPVCPNPDPSPGPVAGVCPNPDPTSPVPGVCPNPDPDSPSPGVCPNPDPSPGPVAGVCPPPSPPGPDVVETATCVVNETTLFIPPGGSATLCHQGGVLFKEVPTAIVVCGDGLPGVDGQCNNATTKVSTGSFNRLLPDTSKSVGDAYVTPYAVHISSDTSNDGLLEPGESASLSIDIVNAGPVNIEQAYATLSAPAVDLSEDGFANPVGIIVGTASASYGTIVGTPVSTDCTAPAPHPASNATVYPVTVPSNHPGDTSHPFILAVTGTVNGSPFAMDVPISLGIADRCDAAANTRDYDGIDGLASPMTKLVPTGDPVPFPTKAFSAGTTRPLKLRLTCGDVNLTDSSVDPPEIVGLSEATRGPLDIRAINLNSDNTNNPNDPFFRFNNTLSGGGQWAYSMRTALIGTGTFTLSVRIAGRKEYVTGFVLE
jgi:hypothetical protein